MGRESRLAVLRRDPSIQREPVHRGTGRNQVDGRVDSTGRCVLHRGMALYGLDGLVRGQRSMMAALPDGRLFSRLWKTGGGTFTGDGAPASHIVDERTFQPLSFR